MYTRRRFGRALLGAIPALPAFAKAAKAAKVNSKINGVRLGLQSACVTFSGMGIDQIIETMVSVGLAEIDVMAEHVENYLGAPGVQLPGTGRSGPWTRPPVSRAAGAAAAHAAPAPAGGVPAPGSVEDWAALRIPWCGKPCGNGAAQSLESVVCDTPAGSGRAGPCRGVDYGALVATDVGALLAHPADGEEIGPGPPERIAKGTTMTQQESVGHSNQHFLRGYLRATGDFAWTATAGIRRRSFSSAAGPPSAGQIDEWEVRDLGTP